MLLSALIPVKPVPSKFYVVSASLSVVLPKSVAMKVTFGELDNAELEEDSASLPASFDSFFIMLLMSKFSAYLCKFLRLLICS